jgi:hypothetical protein
MSSLILRRHVYSSRGVPARFASKSTSTTTSSSSVPSASKKVLKLTTTPLPTPPKVRAPFSRAARQPNRHDYLAHEQKIKAAQEAALAQAKAKLASSQKAKEKAAKAAAAADAAAAPEHASSWAVSAVASSMRVLTGKARLAAKLVGIADPAVASAASRAQHPLASGVSSFGSATRMLVFQRGDVETGSNALTADTLRHTDAILRKWSGDSLAHSIVLQSQRGFVFLQFCLQAH